MSTHCNRIFVFEASGFPEDELSGKPHKIVRHPDMPPEAFAQAVFRPARSLDVVISYDGRTGGFVWITELR